MRFIMFYRTYCIGNVPFQVLKEVKANENAVVNTHRIGSLYFLLYSSQVFSRDLLSSFDKFVFSDAFDPVATSTPYKVKSSENWN